MILTKTYNDIIGADFFCGGGGFTEGIKQACIELGIVIKRWVALNHDKNAIETHEANHPYAEHYRQDVFNANPRKLFPGGFLNLLVASPECIHHSKAKGGGKCNEQSRSGANVIIKWARALDIHTIALENVGEFIDWGPLYKRDCKYGKKDHPIKRLAGTYFNRFIRDLKSLGYNIEYRYLNSADYGGYTSRVRLFLIATKASKISFPYQTHAKDPLDDLFLQPWQPARAVIDWNDPGDNLFARQLGLLGKKPLCPKTIDRICYGMQKFCNIDMTPFLVVLKGQSKVRSVYQPLPTLTTNAHLGLCTPFFIKYRGNNKVADVKNPLPVITTSGNHLGLLQSYLMQYHGGKASNQRVYSLNNPLPVIDTSNRYALLQPFLTKYYGTGANVISTDEPIPTITTKDRFGLAVPISDGTYLSIYYRMLKTHELARGMGFENYKFIGGITATKKMIGNAVEIHTAKALGMSILPMVSKAA